MIACRRHRAGLRRVAAWLAVGVLAASTSRGVAAQEEQRQTQGTDPDGDYAAELPRIAPLSPTQSLERFSIADGFRLELVASEPLVADPIAVSFDADGRLYVVCMRGYSEQAAENLGEIRRLEDSDRDGTFDVSHRFAQGLSWPTGVLCWAGGVYVCVAPDILFLRDTDGDGTADERRVVFSGFGRSNVQGLFNSLRWGLDNRVHGATSSSGAAVTRPGRSSTLSLRGRDFAFDPSSEVIEATSGGGQHGMCFDDWGRKFVCSNSRHIDFVYYDDRYLLRHPKLKAPSPRQLIAVDGGQAEVYRRSPVEPWRIVRTRLRVAGTVPGPVEGGGRAAGYFTGATGVTIYRGHAWPKAYRGQAFIGDVGSNIVHRKRLVRQGVGFRAERVGDETSKKEFLASSEIWFRPVQFANAPDGTLHVLDMYREVIEHPKSLPPAIKRHLDLTSGRDRGRIYRIVPAGYEPAAPVRLRAASTAKLVELLSHENAWHRETAARLIYERQDATAVRALETLAQNGAEPLGRLHALCALDGLGALREKVILQALKDSHARVRERAIRLAEPLARSSALVREALYRLANDSDAGVRHQLAFSLGEFTGAGRLPALERILRRDPEDPWVRTAVLSAVPNESGLLLERLAEDAEAIGDPSLVESLKALAYYAGAGRKEDAMATVLQVVRRLDGAEPLRDLLVRELARGRGGDAGDIERLSAGAGRILKELLSKARREAANSALDGDRRAEALRLLPLGAFEASREVLRSALSVSQPPAVQAAALNALGRFKEAAATDPVIAAWPTLNPRLQQEASEILCARRAGVERLLEALATEVVEARLISPARREWLRNHPDQVLAQRARRLLPERRARAAVVESYRKALAEAGDATRGERVFVEVCSGCHATSGRGVELGPSLPAAIARGRETFLLNVLDPNREVHPQYLSYVAVLRNGETVTGMIGAETATSITLRREAQQTTVVLREDLVELRSSGLSLMPEGLEERISPEAMSDLMRYLEGMAKDATADAPNTGARELRRTP